MDQVKFNLTNMQFTGLIDQIYLNQLNQREEISWCCYIIMSNPQKVKLTASSPLYVLLYASFTQIRKILTFNTFKVFIVCYEISNKSKNSFIFCLYCIVYKLPNNLDENFNFLALSKFVYITELPNRLDKIVYLLAFL